MKKIHIPKTGNQDIDCVGDVDLDKSTPLFNAAFKSPHDFLKPMIINEDVELDKNVLQICNEPNIFAWLCQRLFSFNDPQVIYKLESSFKDD